MLDVARANSLDEPDRVFLRALRLGPELVFVQVIALAEAGHVLLGFGPEQPAGVPLPGEGPVEAPERLDADEIA